MSELLSDLDFLANLNGVLFGATVQQSNDCIAALINHNDALRTKISALEQEFSGIAKMLGCHRAYILETIGEITDRADRTPGADEYRQLQAKLAAIQATVGDTEFSLRQQLATLTQERGRLKEALRYQAQSNARRGEPGGG